MKIVFEGKIEARECSCSCKVSTGGGSLIDKKIEKEREIGRDLIF